MKPIRLAISNVEIAENDLDWQVHRLNDFVLTKVIMKANELGLQGKKIDSIVKVTPNFMDGLYLDFFCEESKQ